MPGHIDFDSPWQNSCGYGRQGPHLDRRLVQPTCLVDGVNALPKRRYARSRITQEELAGRIQSHASVAPVENRDLQRLLKFLDCLRCRRLADAENARGLSDAFQSGGFEETCQMPEFDQWIEHDEQFA